MYNPKRYFRWNDNDKTISFINQRKLPLKEEIITFKDYRKLAASIKTLEVRGAPAIGIAGAYGVAIASYNEKANNIDELKKLLIKATDVLVKTRPTAVNLSWAIERMRSIINNNKYTTIDKLRKAIIEKAKQIDDEEYDLGVKLGKIGAELLPDKCIALTHCNAGGLATGGMGSALAVLYYAKRLGKSVKVYVDETRPLLQGGRLTTYELMNWGIDFELICDDMAGFVMKTKGINVLITGCDRVAANGDTANKIGTYSLSILAKYHNIPFYVASPLSTIDLSISSGGDIPIEQRNPDEVTSILGQQQIAPSDTNAFNPAFDVTPSELITAFITEEGILKSPFEKSLSKLKEKWNKRKKI